MGEEASIVRGKGDDVVEKERLKPRELGAERCRTVLYLHTSAYVSIRQHTSAYVSIRQHACANSARSAGCADLRPTLDARVCKTYIYIHTYVCIHTYMHMYTYIHTYILACIIHTYRHPYIHTHS
jgi:hypothetical protein